MRVLPLFVLGILLAGCASSDAPAPKPIQSVADDDGYGRIRGVVVDSAITPIEGVALTVQGTDLNTTSDADGEFAFDGLPPGSYMVRAELFNHVPEEARVDVAPGAANETIRIVMAQQANRQPMLSPIQFDGHMACSARIPNGGFATGCVVGGFVGDFGNDRTFLDVESGNVGWMQTEMVWEARSATTDTLCLRIIGYGMDDLCGPSGLLQWVDEAGAEAGGIGMGTKVEVIAFADYVFPGTLGIAVEQSFQAFSHVFYNWAPDEGWRFSEHGEPTPP